MVRLRKGPTGTGCTTKLRDQEIVEPSAKKSSRKRIDVPTDAQRGGKRKRPARMQPAAQTEEEPTPLPKFIDDDARESLNGFHRRVSSLKGPFSHLNSVSLTLNQFLNSLNSKNGLTF